MEKFRNTVTRTGTRSVKWDLRESIFQNKDVLPMWVADMDFPSTDAVKDAIVERAQHNIYGYTITDQPVKGAIQQWVKKRHQWDIDEKWLLFSPGVVTSLHMAVQALSNENDHILIQTPVYPPFYGAVEKHGRKIVKNSLQLKDGRYEIDFEDFEQKVTDDQVTLFILCSPHNPLGRVWTEDELHKMADLCLKHNVTIISDEIHGDLTYPEHTHIPMASFSDEIREQVITCMAPSKTFNLAGLQASYLIVPNEKKRKSIEKQFSSQGLGMLNTFGIVAMEAAYLHGEEWLDQLIQVLDENKKYVQEKIHEHTDQIKVLDAEGTYLLWLDCRQMGLSSSELKQFFVSNAKVGLNDGLSFGREGDGFMRMNIACPNEIVVEGVNRIIQALNG
ncbi:MalY/PatB family protein [Salinibacillus xinjiangensis]|uniref:cysteine-S-conjugate beta-lyase n=1 Tax=Salinibacillus xinjiangensis TaxID=1229268 RepID=A0A6G1X2S0_9BACI|nr:PatB family C-S lyase [Salinibacillus xinjiangensis]MRG85200.1 putative C-S lyase [Salinibacillus xinjiangensis]